MPATKLKSPATLRAVRDDEPLAATVAFRDRASLDYGEALTRLVMARDAFAAASSSDNAALVASAKKDLELARDIADAKYDKLAMLASMAAT